MTIVNFIEKYGLSKDLIYVGKSTGTLPAELFYRPHNSNTDYIHESFLIRRVEFKKKVRLYNQDMYYFISEHISVAEYARSIAQHYGGVEGSIYNHLHSRLFGIDDSSLVNYKINDVDWKIFRYNRKVMIALNRMFNIKFDVEKILDIRMEDEN